MTCREARRLFIAAKKVFVPKDMKAKTNPNPAISSKTSVAAKPRVKSVAPRPKAASAVETSEHRQAEYLEALHQTTLGLMRRLDLNELLSMIVARARQLLNTRHGCIYLRVSETDLELKVGEGTFKPYIGLRTQSGQGLGGKVWQTGGPIIIDDYHQWSGRLKDVDASSIRAMAGVPLRSGDNILGVLGVAYDMDSDQEFGS